VCSIGKGMVTMDHIAILKNGLILKKEVRIPTLLERDSIQLKTVIKEQITYYGVKTL